MFDLNILKLNPKPNPRYINLMDIAWFEANFGADGSGLFQNRTGTF